MLALFAPFALRQPSLRYIVRYSTRRGLCRAKHPPHDQARQQAIGCDRARETVLPMTLTSATAHQKNEQLRQSKVIHCEVEPFALGCCMKVYIFDEKIGFSGESVNLG